MTRRGTPAAVLCRTRSLLSRSDPAPQAMATGREKKIAYREAMTRLGKDLARRAKSKCELSGERGGLVAVDLHESEQSPELSSVILVCSEISEHLAGRGLDGPLHYLNDAVWSTEPSVRLAAETILVQIDAPWARDALDNVRLMNASTGEDAT
jgi:protein PhnA